MVIGLTGGIGCGKSAAAACFAEFGFNVVDADQLAREVLESAGCVSQLRARWGDACLTADGRPDRRWIAAKVFGEPAELAFLEEPGARGRLAEHLEVRDRRHPARLRSEMEPATERGQLAVDGAVCRAGGIGTRRCDCRRAC